MVYLSLLLLLLGAGDSGLEGLRSNCGRLLTGAPPEALGSPSSCCSPSRGTDGSSSSSSSLKAQPSKPVNAEMVPVFRLQ